MAGSPRKRHHRHAPLASFGSMTASSSLQPQMSSASDSARQAPASLWICWSWNLRWQDQPRACRDCLATTHCGKGPGGKRVINHAKNQRTTHSILHGKLCEGTSGNNNKSCIHIAISSVGTGRDKDSLNQEKVSSLRTNTARVPVAWRTVAGSELRMTIRVLRLRYLRQQTKARGRRFNTVL